MFLWILQFFGTQNIKLVSDLDISTPMFGDLEETRVWISSAQLVWSSCGQYLSKIIINRLLSSFPWERVLTSWQNVLFLGAVPPCSQKLTILGLFKPQVQLFFLILALPTKWLEDCFGSYLRVFKILLSMQLSMVQTWKTAFCFGDPIFNDHNSLWQKGLKNKAIIMALIYNYVTTLILSYLFTYSGINIQKMIQ